MTIRKLLTLTVCTALLGCSDDPEQTQQVPPTTGFGNRLSGLTATIPGADVTDKSSTTRTGADETGATVWLVDDAITVTEACTPAHSTSQPASAPQPENSTVRSISNKRPFTPSILP